MKYVIKSCLSLRVSRFLKLSSTSNVKIFNHKGRNDSKFPHDFCNPRKLDSSFSQIAFVFFKFRAVLYVVNKVVRYISVSSFTSVSQIIIIFQLSTQRPTREALTTRLFKESKHTLFYKAQDQLLS